MPAIVVDAYEVAARLLILHQLAALTEWGVPIEYACFEVLDHCLIAPNLAHEVADGGDVIGGPAFRAPRSVLQEVVDYTHLSLLATCINDWT